MKRACAGVLVVVAATAWCFGVLVAAPAAAQVKGTKDAKPGAGGTADGYERGVAAFRAQRFATAIPLLRDFIGATAGDPRLAEARTMLADAYRGRADARAKAGDPCGAAAALAEGAAYFKSGDDADALRTRAREVLSAAFASARQNDAELAAAVARQHSTLFKDDPPLAAGSDLQALDVAALAQLVRAKAPPEAAWARLAALPADGEELPRVLLEQHKVDPEDLAFAYATELIERRRWYAKALEILRPIEAGAPDEQTKRRCQTLVAKALAGHLEACLALGNEAMLEQAVAAAAAYPAALSSASGRKAKAAVAKAEQARAAGKAPKPLVLGPDKPLVGEGNLLDSGAGIVLSGRVAIGREKGEGRNDGVVTVPAGAVVNGGTLVVERGRLALKGEPKKPVVLRGVEVVCTMNGVFEADHAVFIDCKFRKGGGWYIDFYTSKWTFANCALLRSNFASLNKVDYGIKLTQCTLVECELPRRLLHRDKPEDVAARYQGGWNAVDDCDFLDCTVRPSFVWTTDRCNFSQCRVSDADAFHSTTPLAVALHAPKWEEAFQRELAARTEAALEGTVHYVTAGRPFPRKGASLWPWLVSSPDVFAPAPATRPAAKKGG